MKRSSTWLIFLFLAVIAVSFTVAMTFEDLRIGTVETIEVQYFVAGGGLAAIFAAIAMYLWLNEVGRRKQRMDAAVVKKIRRSQVLARDLALYEAQERALAERELAEAEQQRAFAEQRTETLPAYAVYDYFQANAPRVTYDRIRQGVAFDLAEMTGDTPAGGFRRN